MDWKAYVVIGLMIAVGILSNLEGVRQVIRELYNKRKGAKDGAPGESRQ